MTARLWNYQDGDVALAGELYPPKGTGNGKAVLVVHEADGIGGNVRRHCAKLAELGYTAAAADMHGGGRVLEADEIPAALEAFKRDPAFFRRRVRAALDALSDTTGLSPNRIAAIGYCFGGMAVLELARSGAPVAAVASFHGILSTQAPAGKGEISARVLACTGALDPLVPPEQLAEFQAEMTSAGSDWHLLIHGRALHSYTNEDVDKLGDPRMAYDAAAARQSWSALLTFLDETFAGSPRAAGSIQRLEKRIRRHAGLTQNSPEGSPLDLPVQRHHAATRAAPKDDMAASLPQLHEPQPFQCPHDLRPGKDRIVRHSLEW